MSSGSQEKLSYGIGHVLSYCEEATWAAEEAEVDEGVNDGRD